MALAMAKDLRVVVIKLADRLHNMRTLGVMPPEKKRRIAKETLEIYSPIAQRLGMNDWRVEFEDQCFKAMHPLRSSRLQASLQKVRGNRRSIVIPKVNGYQSLHTVVIGKGGVPIEVQIRTKEMDELASSGVAAHWLYKTTDTSDTAAVASFDRANRWIKRLMEIRQHTQSSVEFVENVKIDLFKDEVCSHRKSAQCSSALPKNAATYWKYQLG